MLFKNISLLEDYVSEIDSFLKNSDNHHQIDYSCIAVSGWNVSEIQSANSDLLCQISGNANIYALFISEPKSNNYELKYIGKTTKKLARQRLRNHLITKHKKTAAKLANVMFAVKDGGKCKIAYVSVTPESLRNYVEEELINRNPSAIWNRENA